MPVRDVRGRVFDPARVPQRIVSLVPSLTEALFAFGAGDRVVGVTEYCVHPPEGVAVKAKIGGTKNPRVDEILALTPDLVIANVEENRKSDVTLLEAHGVPVFVTFPRTVRAAVDELCVLGELVSAPNLEAIVAPLRAAYARRIARPAPHKPRVFVAIWREPWMTANGDTYIGDLIETCGGENVFADRVRLHPLGADLGRTLARDVPGADTRYPRVSLDQVAALKPDVILLPDEPYRFAERDADELRAVPALRDARVHLVDGTLVSWYGVRMERAMEVISGLVQSKG